MPRLCGSRPYLQHHENGKFALKADMFDLDGKAIEGATVQWPGSSLAAKDATNNIGLYKQRQLYNDNFVYMVASHNIGS